MGVKSSKSMRVATIFTGVAACTAGFTQAANAQDVVHTPVNHAAFPAARSTGSIRQISNCHDLAIKGTSEWQTDATYGPVGGGYSVCYGYKGTWQSPPGTGLSAECGGNNRGWLYGTKNYSTVVFDSGSDTHTPSSAGVTFLRFTSVDGPAAMNVLPPSINLTDRVCSRVLSSSAITPLSRSTASAPRRHSYSASVRGLLWHWVISAGYPVS